jgi:hypothetical protein
VATDEINGLLNEIGQLLTADRDYPLEPTLLYAQLDDNMVGESIFKKLGNQILYRWAINRRLPFALLELWEAQDGGERWTELEYLCRDGRFEVVYIYPEEIDPDEDVVERRARAVQRRFGEKPIVYPPWPPEDGVLDYDV